MELVDGTLICLVRAGSDEDARPASTRPATAATRSCCGTSRNWPPIICRSSPATRAKPTSAWTGRPGSGWPKYGTRIAGGATSVVSPTVGVVDPAASRPDGTDADYFAMKILYPGGTEEMMHRFGGLQVWCRKKRTDGSLSRSLRISRAVATRMTSCHKTFERLERLLAHRHAALSAPESHSTEGIAMSNPRYKRSTRSTRDCLWGLLHHGARPERHHGLQRRHGTGLPAPMLYGRPRPSRYR